MRGAIRHVDRQRRIIWSRSAAPSRMMLVMCPILVSGRGYGIVDRPSGLARSHVSVASPLPPLHVRWAVKSGCWKPSLTQWNEALSLISQDEREKVVSQRFFEDARNRLTGQLLISKLGRMLFSPPPGEGQDNSAFDSDRVPEGKIPRGEHPVAMVKRLPSGRPFIVGAPKDLQFSVAHDGMWVVMEASRSGGHVGCDIIQTTRKTRLERLPRVFTDHEWKQVKSVESEALRRIRLMRRWAVKEAVVKALGVGIKFGMNNVHVDVANEPCTEQEEGLRTTNERKGKTTLREYFEGSSQDPFHASSCSPNLDDSSSIAGCTATVSVVQPEENAADIEIPENWKICLGKLDSDHLWASACGWNTEILHNAAKVVPREHTTPDDVSSQAQTSINSMIYPAKVPLRVMSCEELVEELMMNE